MVRTIKVVPHMGRMMIKVLICTVECLIQGNDVIHL